MTLSIIIVNYNVRTFLAECLRSVERASEGLDTEVWVVDNASSDGSVEAVRAEFPSVRVIANDENVGFARANNQAIRLSNGRYVLLLNPDTVVGEDVLHTCVSFLDAHKRAGALGVSMLDRNGAFARESRRGLPTPMTAFYKMSGLCSLFPTSPRFGRYYMGHLDATRPNRIEVMSGAFLMARREALDEVGLMDEDYFMYGEDIDLSYRLLQAGWENWYIPCRILHYKGESTQKSSFRYVQRFYAAMLIFFNKHFARRYRLTTIIVRFGVGARASLGFARNAIAKAFMWLRGFKQFHSKLPDEDTSSETVYYFGSDEGWEFLTRAIPPKWTAQRRDNPFELYDRSTEPSYVVFDTDSLPYHTILETMASRHESGHTAHVGLISASTQRLVLP